MINAAHQATSGGGGWPMSVFLTPDLQPFLGGTYFPPQDAYGRPGVLLTSFCRALHNSSSLEIISPFKSACPVIPH